MSPGLVLTDYQSQARSSDNYNDFEAANLIQDRLQAIRERHQKNRECLLEQFVMIRKQLKDTIEFCGEVGSQLTQNNNTEGLK